MLLAGMMGSGKSTVGPRLGEELSRPFYDVDREVAEQAGKPISEIFAADGELAFRQLESEALTRLIDSPMPSVIALGGGTLLDPQNRMKIAGQPVIWLDLAPEELWRRVHKSQRPLLGQDFESFRSLYAFRRPIYRETQTFYLRCDHLEPDEIVSRIVSWVKGEMHI
jgi:shikimate kinase